MQLARAAQPASTCCSRQRVAILGRENAAAAAAASCARLCAAATTGLQREGHFASNSVLFCAALDVSAECRFTPCNQARLLPRTSQEWCPKHAKCHLLKTDSAMLSSRSAAAKAWSTAASEGDRERKCCGRAFSAASSSSMVAMALCAAWNGKGCIVHSAAGEHRCAGGGRGRRRAVGPAR